MHKVSDLQWPGPRRTGNAFISALASYSLLEEWTNELSGGSLASMIANGLREFIEANQYDYVDVGNDCYRLRFSGKNGDYTCLPRPPRSRPKSWCSPTAR